MSDLSGFIFFEARPKFRQHERVRSSIIAITTLCQELFVSKELGPFRLTPNVFSNRKMSMQIILDDLDDRDKLQENRRYQELLIDIRLASRRDRLLRFKKLKVTRYRLTEKVTEG